MDPREISGTLDADFEICDEAAVPMEKVSQIADGAYLFAAHSAACRESGLHGSSSPRNCRRIGDSQYSAESVSVGLPPPGSRGV